MLLAPFSQQRFDSFAKQYRLSRLQAATVACAGAVVAAVFVIVAYLLLGTVAKYYYLETFGMEAIAAAARASTHISEGRHQVRTKWEKLDRQRTDRGAHRAFLGAIDWTSPAPSKRATPYRRSPHPHWKGLPLCSCSTAA